MRMAKVVYPNSFNTCFVGSLLNMLLNCGLAQHVKDPGIPPVRRKRFKEILELFT